MGNLTVNREAPPLLKVSEAEIEHLLRGFPDRALEGARSLAQGSKPEAVDECLLGILTFYLPSGTAAPEGNPSPGMQLRDEMGLDSLSMAEAMFKIEELFGIRVENAELAEVFTLGDARDLLLRKLKDQAPSE